MYFQTDNALFLYSQNYWICPVSLEQLKDCAIPELQRIEIEEKRNLDSSIYEAGTLKFKAATIDNNTSFKYKTLYFYNLDFSLYCEGFVEDYEFKISRLYLEDKNNFKPFIEFLVKGFTDVTHAYPVDTFDTCSLEDIKEFIKISVQELLEKGIVLC